MLSSQGGHSESCDLVFSSVTLHTFIVNFGTILVSNKDLLLYVLAHQYRVLEWQHNTFGELVRTSIIVAILIVLQWVIIGNTWAGAQAFHRG